MTHLRQIMLEELWRRNYAESTIHAYIHTVEHFSRHFHRSPDQLGAEHIRQYQAALFTRRKLAPNTVTQHFAALRFFYVQVLKRAGALPKHRIRRRCCTCRRSDDDSETRDANRLASQRVQAVLALEAEDGKTADSVAEAFPYDSTYKYLIFDRDAKFGFEVIEAVKAFGSKPLGPPSGALGRTGLPNARWEVVDETCSIM